MANQDKIMDILKILYEQWIKDARRPTYVDTICELTGMQKNEVELSTKLIIHDGYAHERFGHNFVQITAWGVDKIEESIEQSLHQKRKEERKLILDYLKTIYEQNVHVWKNSADISKIINMEDPFYLYAQVDYLDQKGLVEMMRFSNGFNVKLTESGYQHDEETSVIPDFTRVIEELSSSIEKKISKSNSEESLDLPILKEDFPDGLRVFISHRFIKTDQELASILQSLLLNNHINGYLAERQRQYELPISEKIQNEVRRSDCLVAIFTNESIKSASVNQEIGYALGIGVPLIIMIEKGLLSGVLTHGRDPEEFTRDKFEVSCKNVLDYIIQKGKRIKISDEEKKQLVDNVYRPCYNQMMNEYERREFINGIPSNKWKDLEHFWRHKTEPEMREIFENYTSELEKWKQMWLGFANNAQSKQYELGELIKSAFERVGLLDKTMMIPTGHNSAIHPKDWLLAFEFVIFNKEIHDKEELYKILHDFSLKTNNGHAKWLEEFYKTKPELFLHILELIPRLIERLNTPVTIEQINQQREILRTHIEKLKNALEDKLR